MNIIKRQKALKEVLIKHKIDALLVSSLENIRYLSGFSGSSGVLLACAQEIILFTDGRYTQQAKEEVSGARVHITNILFDDLANTLKSHKLKQVGIEAQHMTVAGYKKLQKLVSGFASLAISHDIVEELRLIKDGTEIEYIKQAAKIAYEAYASIEADIKPGISERELANKLEWAIKSKGGEKNPFEIIVASGWRSALPHGIASDKLLAEGEFVVIDFGASVCGYNSDMTRTTMLGKMSAEQKKIYKTVAKSQENGIKAIKAGIEAAQIDRVVRGVIKDAGYGEYFVHSTGHGLGLNVHEGPRIGNDDKTILKEGMVFTMEPGIYVPDIGGVRIEDMVLVTSNGYEILSQ